MRDKEKWNKLAIEYEKAEEKDGGSVTGTANR